MADTASNYSTVTGTPKPPHTEPYHSKEDHPHPNPYPHPRPEQHPSHHANEGLRTNEGIKTPNEQPGRRTGRVRAKTPQAALARSVYLKTVCGGVFMVVVLIFAVLSIFWGSLWKTPAHQLPGWVVDFDGGEIGQTVLGALSSSSPAAKSGAIAWTLRPASDFPGGLEEIAHRVLEDEIWVAVTVNPQASARLSASLASPNASYDGTEAVTVFAVEARNENGFRSLIRPTIQGTFDALSASFARSVAQRVSASASANSNTSNVISLLATSSQTVTAPLGYRMANLAPFDVPVATAVTFVGLIYQLILSFFVVMLSHAAREASGYERTLRTRSLIILRLATAFAEYFVVSLFYSLLSVAFGLDVSRKFGHSGFLVFWMLNYCSMLACGLALEAMITILTTRFISFFMLTWLISNLSVCVFPIPSMPHIFRYGYGAPFYNVSQAIRAVVFGTKNVVGLSFGVLIAWIAISCLTLPLFQVLVHRRAESASYQSSSHQSSSHQSSSHQSSSHQSSSHPGTNMGNAGREDRDDEAKENPDLAGKGIKTRTQSFEGAQVGGRHEAAEFESEKA